MSIVTDEVAAAVYLREVKGAYERAKARAAESPSYRWAQDVAEYAFVDGFTKALEMVNEGLKATKASGK